jgi:hypothetical protein
VDAPWRESSRLASARKSPLAPAQAASESQEGLLWAYRVCRGGGDGETSNGESVAFAVAFAATASFVQDFAVLTDWLAGGVYVWAALDLAGSELGGVGGGGARSGFLRIRIAFGRSDCMCGDCPPVSCHATRTRTTTGN